MFRGKTVAILMIGLVATASFLLAACGGSSAVVDQTPTPAATETPTPSEQTPTKTPVPVGTLAPTPVVDDEANIVVHHKGALKLGEKYRFNPAVIRLEVGKEHILELVGGEEFHTFTVPGLGVDVRLGPGETQHLTLKVDKPGEYKLVCSPHEHLGMVGTIVVR